MPIDQATSLLTDPGVAAPGRAPELVDHHRRPDSGMACEPGDVLLPDAHRRHPAVTGTSTATGTETGTARVFVKNAAR